MNKLLLSLLLILSYQTILSCSMICFRDASGQTWIGNNEDYIDPDTWMWTLDKGKGDYGAVYFGFGNYFAQGGMNEAGLVFDGFAMESLEVKNLKGKKKTNATKLVNKIMRNCATTAEVKNILLQYQLDFLASAQLMFVDKSGASLIVEGDAVIEKAPEQYQICTNFYQSNISSHSDITCERYLSGYQIMETSPMKARGKDLCLSVINAMHQEGFWGGTQYSNVYDPQNGLIYLYLFHNYEEEVSLSVRDLLAKQDKPQALHTLFQQTEGYDAYSLTYTTADSLTQGLEESIDQIALTSTLSKLSQLEQTKLFSNRFFEYMENRLKKAEFDMALEVGFFCKSFFPNTWQVYAILAKTYAMQDDFEKASNHIEQALSLSPGNPQLIESQSKIKEKMAE
ncbi:MAG: linear amide C-N hydrolase [Bacteroidota bacterium]